MAAEVAGVCVLTGVLDLIFCNCWCAQSVDVSSAEFGFASYEHHRVRACSSASKASVLKANVFCVKFSDFFTESSGQLPACASCGSAKVHGPPGI